MIKLIDQQLSTAALDHLQQYQQKIDAEPTYADKVRRASTLWKPKNATFDEVFRQLVVMCPGTQRCCYCEDAQGTDIEHFKPKTLYPELTFAWTNYLLACSSCNQRSKRDKFAVFDVNGEEQDVSRDYNAPKVPPIEGKPLLINPRYEDPLDFLRIDIANTFHFMPVRGLDGQKKQRAEYTIALLQLNKRVELVAWRKKAFRAFVGWVDTYRRYKQSPDTYNLQAHLDELKTYNHIAVWEEMKRVYSGRDTQHWATLLTRYAQLKEIDALFTEFPELLDIGV